MNKREVGSGYELIAGEYLSKNGVSDLIYNYRTRYGEIDIIGRDGDALVFFEVKYRSKDKMGYAAQAVTYKKQSRICRVSDYYMTTERISYDTQIRYDVIAIDGDKLDWIKNAFEYIPR
ncbi:MAG: YraN family protein [Lachnospiraceae bacterium]|nr:YraN family protein [Lachnospiraceae bacterium]